MIEVSEAYKQLMQSVIRPKCEPIIKVSGVDNTGTETEIIWGASDIIDLKYKRSVDPIGRELPSMELTWKELYTDKLTVENYPEKYNNVLKYMTVELSFVQNLGFYNTWKTLFASGRTWKDFFSNNITWKELKNIVSTETITLPKLYLTARPTLEGKTITWEARDILSFLNEQQIKSFEKPNEAQGLTTFYNPIRYFLLNERANFINSEDMFKAIQDTDTAVKEFANTYRVSLDGSIIFNGATKNLIMNHAQTHNFYFDFKGNHACLKHLDLLKDSGVVFTGDTLLDYPKITKGTNISTYNYKTYSLKKDETKKYDLEPTRAYEIHNWGIYAYDFDEYGEAYDMDGNKMYGEINHCYSYDWETVTVTPILWQSKDNTKEYSKIGETYTEDNPCLLESVAATSRGNRLNEYFNENICSMEFSCLPNLSLETNDIVSVETNFFNADGERIVKKGIIIGVELNYNGALSEKITCHETTKAS